MHPDIIAEFPGIETEDMYNTDVVGLTVAQGAIPSFATRAANACVNARLDTDDQRQARGVSDEKAEDGVIEIYDSSMEDFDLGVYVKREKLNVAPIVETVIEDEDDEPAPLGRGQRTINPPVVCTPRWKGTGHTDKQVGFP